MAMENCHSHMHTQTEYILCDVLQEHAVSLPLMINSHAIYDTWKLNTDSLLKGHKSHWTVRETELHWCKKKERKKEILLPSDISVVR